MGTIVGVEDDENDDIDEPEQNDEPAPIVARWSKDALRWGMAHPDVHGLADVLKGRVADPREGDSADRRDTYMIVATQDQIWHAISEVNSYIAERRQGDPEAMDADDFQKALAFPPRAGKAEPSPEVL